jgi:hypothetical protein
MQVKAMVPGAPWTDYTVASALSGKTYRVALRGMQRGQSYCSCPDFRKNLLGTCKHVLKVQAWVKRKYAAAKLGLRWTPERFGVFARYDDHLRLGLEAPARMSAAAKRIVSPWRDRFAREGAELVELVEVVRKLSQLGEDVTVYPDAEEILGQALHRHRMRELVAQIRNFGAHPAATRAVARRAAHVSSMGSPSLLRAARCGRRDELGQTIRASAWRAPREAGRDQRVLIMRLVEVAVARGDRPLLRAQRTAGERQGCGALTRLFRRRVLHHLQL